MRGKGGPTLLNLRGEAKEVLGRHEGGASIEEEEGARGIDGGKEEEDEAPCTSDGWWSNKRESFDTRPDKFSYGTDANNPQILAR